MTAAIDHAIEEDEQPQPITLTGVIDTVKTETVGSVLAADASSGAGSVFVDDTGEFDQAGGTLAIGGSQYVYTAVNDTTGEITLTGTLSAGASDGDRVDVWDVANNAAAQETVALVALPGKNATEDFMYASVAPGVDVRLPVGQRADGTGESVRIISYDGGLEWELIGLKGSRNIIQTGYVPSSGGGGSAVEAYGFFDATNGGSFTGPLLRIAFADSGSDPAFYTVTAGDVDTIVVGQYQAHLSAYISSCDPGDMFRIYMENGLGSIQFAGGYGVANSSGLATISAVTAVSVDQGTGPTFPAWVEQVSGTGTIPFLQQCHVEIWKFRE